MIQHVQAFLFYYDLTCLASDTALIQRVSHSRVSAFCVLLCDVHLCL